MSLSYLFSRLSVGLPSPSTWTNAIRSISSTSSFFISSTPCLYGEPLKKKKRLDPQILKIREDRTKRKLEKSIRRMQKFTMPLKPVDEMLVPLHVQDQNEMRKRVAPALSPEEEDERILQLKIWTKNRLQEHYADIRMLDRISYSQQRALDELRQESEELYKAALQIDPSLVPREVKGPVVTPPIIGYDSPDGDYHNVSYKWE